MSEVEIYLGAGPGEVEWRGYVLIRVSIHPSTHPRKSKISHLSQLPPERGGGLGGVWDGRMGEGKREDRREC